MKHKFFWLALYCEKVVWQTHSEFLPIHDDETYREKIPKDGMKRATKPDV